MARFPTSLGNVRTPRTQLETFSPRVSPEAFGAGVGVALAGLGADLSQMAEYQGQINKFDAQKKFLTWRGETMRAQLEAAQNAEPGMPGFADERYAAINESEKAFFESIDPSLVDEFKTQTEQVKQTLTTDAFRLQLKEQERFQAGALQVALDDMRETLIDSPDSSPTIVEDWTGLVNNSTLSPAVKQEIVREGLAALRESEYLGKYRQYADSEAIPDDNALAAAIGAPANALGNLVGKLESGDRYNVYNNGTATGGTFDDFSDHPRIFTTLPDGTVTSAAGRYQFTASTWDWVAGKLGLTDFSPASQDKAFWWLAQHLYRKSTGNELTDAINSGNRNEIENIRKTLTAANGGWAIFDNMSDDAFANRLLGGEGVRGEVIAARTAPDIWTNPYWDEIDHDRKFELARKGQQMVDDAISQRNAELRADKAAKLNQLLIDVRDGRKFADDIIDAQRSWLTDFDDQQKVWNVLDKKLKGQKDLLRFSEKIGSPTAIWSYADADDRAAMDAFFEQSVDAEKLMSEHSEAFRDQLLVPIAEKTRMVSPFVMNKLKGMAQSRDVADVTYAYNTMAALEDSANAAWMAVVSEDDIRKLHWWRTTAHLYMDTPETLVQRVNRLTDSKDQPLMAPLREAADKYIREELDDSVIVNGFGGWFSSPDLPENALLTGAFRQTFNNVFREEYVAYNGDADKALEAATKVMMKRWGATEVGGRYRVAQYAPETIYPAFGQHGGDKEWIEEQARIELAQFDPRFTTEGMEFMLIADGKTETEYKTFEDAKQKGGDVTLPSYLVWYLNEDGQLLPLKDDANRSVRWRGEINEGMKELLDVKITRQNTEELQRRNRNRLLELQENLPFMSDEDQAEAQEEIKRLQRKDEGLGKSLEEFDQRFRPGSAGEVVSP